MDMAIMAKVDRLIQGCLPVWMKRYRYDIPGPREPGVLQGPCCRIPLKFSMNLIITVKGAEKAAVICT